MTHACVDVIERPIGVAAPALRKIGAEWCRSPRIELPAIARGRYSSLQ